MLYDEIQKAYLVSILVLALIFCCDVEVDGIKSSLVFSIKSEVVPSK